MRSPARPLRRSAVACLLLLGTLILAAPADAGVRDFRIGVVTGGLVSGGDLNSMREERVRTVRFIFNWDSIQTQRRSGRSCSSAEYGGFERYDDLISAASRRGLRLLPFFLGSPRYAAPQPANMPKTGTRAMGDYKCFVRAVVKRYGRGGSYFNSLNPNGDPLTGDPRAKPITEWQVWNEQNLPNYAANERPNPREYGRFLKLTSGQIRRVDRHATIVLGGMPEFGPKGPTIQQYMRGLYKVKGIKRAFDAMAFHPYAKNARTVRDALVRLRRLLRNLHDARRYVWLTEIGFATGGRKDQRLVKTERGQAKQLANTFRMLRANRKRFKVGTVHWFRWRDQKTYAQNNQAWPNYAGLYRKAGSPKPACNRFARVTGGRRPCRRIRKGSGGSVIPLPNLPLLRARAG